jgi:hypothetical protein
MAKGSRSVETESPEPGKWSVDASPVAGFARYRRQGEPPVRRREQVGLDDVFKEIFDNQLILGTRAGVTAEDIAALQLSNDQIATVRGYLRTARKLVEILEYTEADVDDTRHKRIHTIANSVDRRSQVRGNEDLILHYRKTREYRSATAVKAARTRRRRLEESKASGGVAPVIKGSAGKKSSRKRPPEETLNPSGPLPSNDSE